MIPFSGKAILLDIEGTTSSISFVYDVMFPYVRRELNGFLEKNWGSDDLNSTSDLIAQDAGHENLASWQPNAADQQQAIHDEVIRLMDNDVKATGLKSLQGAIWKDGFEGGEMKAHVYDDVPPALSAWNEQGIDVRIYSSGSVKAQLLFFGHTVSGNLLPCFRGHYDTTTGPKRESKSYSRIAEDMALPSNEILFLSDVVEELNAAKEAGMQAGLCIRPGNKEVSVPHSHAKITSFAQIELV